MIKISEGNLSKYFKLEISHYQPYFIDLFDFCRKNKDLIIRSKIGLSTPKLYERGVG